MNIINTATHKHGPLDIIVAYSSELEKDPSIQSVYLQLRIRRVAEVMRDHPIFYVESNLKKIGELFETFKAKVLQLRAFPIHQILSHLPKMPKDHQAEAKENEAEFKSYSAEALLRLKEHNLITADIVDYLIKVSPNPEYAFEERNSQGIIPLQCAATNKNIKAIDSLLLRYPINRRDRIAREVKKWFFKDREKDRKIVDIIGPELGKILKKHRSQEGMHYYLSDEICICKWATINSCPNLLSWCVNNKEYIYPDEALSVAVSRCDLECSVLLLQINSPESISRCINRVYGSLEQREKKDKFYLNLFQELNKRDPDKFIDLIFYIVENNNNRKLSFLELGIPESSNFFIKIIENSPNLNSYTKQVKKDSSANESEELTSLIKKKHPWGGADVFKALEKNVPFYSLLLWRSTLDRAPYPEV